MVRVLVGELDVAALADVDWGVCGEDVVARSGGLAVVACLSALDREAWAGVTVRWAHLVGATPQEGNNCMQCRVFISVVAVKIVKWCLRFAVYGPVCGGCGRLVCPYCTRNKMIVPG